MFSLLTFGIICWFLFLHFSSKGWRKCKIPYKIRGGGGGDTETTSHVFYYYRIKSPHNSIDPSQPILCYNAFGDLVYTIPPYDSNANYGEGIYSVPGTEQNTTIESIATATYYVFYSTGDLVIDYENAEFKIAKKLIRSTAQTSVKGTFQYLSVITPFKDVASVIDGRWDTQVQTAFFAEPPTGYNYAILDLGSVKTIQAIDTVAGFYKPDDVRKYDVDFNITLQYSIDGITYYNISDKTYNVQFTGGKSVSFEENDLGIGFQARYLKLILENVKKIEYGSVYVTVSETNRVQLINQLVITNSVASGTQVLLRSGIWAVAITEISAYDNIVIKGESTLISTTELTEDITLSGLSSGSFPTQINVQDTTGFNSSGTAYIDNGDGTFDSFTYTGKGTSFFYGVSGLGEDHSDGDMVVQEIEGDNTLYDYNYLRPKLGDRIYKENKVSDETLFTQSQIDYLAKRYLLEFVKNHSRCSIEVMFSPHIEIGQTLQLIDATNSINDRYFVESMTINNNMCSLILAKYP